MNGIHEPLWTTVRPGLRANRHTRKFDGRSMVHGPSSRFELENKLKFFVSRIFKKLGEVKNGSSRQFGR